MDQNHLLFKRIPRSKWSFGLRTNHLINIYPPYTGKIRSTRLLGSNTLTCQSPISIQHVYLIYTVIWSSRVPKIAARWRQMEFCIFCAKSRQNEMSSVVRSLNVNKLSRIFSWFFFCEISHQNERSSALCSLNVNKVSQFFFHDFFLWKISSKWKEFCIV